MLAPCWAHFQNIFGSTLKRKNEALEAEIVARILDALGVVDRDAFLGRFHTTVAKDIYLAWDKGDEPDDYRQLVVCAHEHQHVHQFAEQGVLYLVDYIVRPESRALYEAEAYSTAFDLEYARSGQVPASMLDEVMSSLASYALGAHLDTAHTALVAHMRTARLGMPQTPAARIAIRLLTP